VESARNGTAVTVTADIQMMESSKITICFGICFGTDNEHSNLLRRNKPWRLNTDDLMSTLLWYEK
jgi:hypothetical protein